MSQETWGGSEQVGLREQWLPGPDLCFHGNKPMTAKQISELTLQEAGEECSFLGM